MSVHTETDAGIILFMRTLYLSFLFPLSLILTILLFIPSLIVEFISCLINTHDDFQLTEVVFPITMFIKGYKDIK